MRRDKGISIAGGASVIQRYMKAGLLNELEIHIIPVLLRSGTRLLDNLGSEPIRLERIMVVDSAAVTHVKYRVTDTGCHCRPLVELILAMSPTPPRD